MKMETVRVAPPEFEHNSGISYYGRYDLEQEEVLAIKIYFERSVGWRMLYYQSIYIYAGGYYVNGQADYNFSVRVIRLRRNRCCV